MHSEFTVIDTLRDPDNTGVAARITVRDKPNGYRSFSFSIFKEFEREPGGATQRSAFLNDWHIEAAHKLLDRVAERIEQEKAKVHGRRRRAR